jgi:hypothetical protein
MEKRAEDDFLELIPKRRLSYQQIALRPRRWRRKNMPTYRFRRDPSHLNEIDWKKYRNTFLWRDNKTIIHVGDFDEYFITPKKHISFYILYGNKEVMRCAVYGKTDVAVAETISSLWSLRAVVEDDNQGRTNSLLIDFVINFDVTALTTEQLIRVLDANPKREIYIAGGVWSTQQAVVMAMRPYTLNLKLGGEPFAFEDDGTAFVNALETRQTPFGSLRLCLNKDEQGFSRANMERLLNLEVLGNIKIVPVSYEGRFLEPLSAKVNELDYDIEARYYQPEDFETLLIPAKDLKLTWYMDETNNYNRLLISFLNRIAQLGHVESLRISTYGNQWVDDHETLDFIEFPELTKALIGAITGNKKLKHLDLSHCYFMGNFLHHLDFKEVFQAIENHEGLRTLLIYGYPREDPSYCWLKRLLSRNRYITVLDNRDQKCSDGSSVDQLYTLNYFYCGSADLMKDSSLMRPALIVTALTESASRNFQRTALSLFHHTEMLCEIIHELVGGGERSVDPPISIEAVLPIAATTIDEAKEFDPLNRKAKSWFSGSPKKRMRYN